MDLCFYFHLTSTKGETTSDPDETTIHVATTDEPTKPLNSNNKHTDTNES